MIAEIKETSSQKQSEMPSLVLRPLKKSDRHNVCCFMTSSYILQHSFVIPGPKKTPSDFATYQYALRYFDVLVSDPKRLVFAIMVNELHIGNVGLKEIDVSMHSAECFIEIGKCEYRRRGFGLTALKKMLDIAFNELNFQKIELEVLEFNFPALKMYERLGFVVCGQSGWHYDEFGQHWRVLKMNLFKSVWLSFMSEGFVA